jgi:hypothetical protein
MANPNGRFRGQRRPPKGGPSQRQGGLSLRQVAEGQFELVHPPCVEERAEDYEEAMEVCRAGEVEEARDILRYALEGCSENVWIHSALGKLALEADKNLDLARGHFGYACELVQKALPQPFRGRLPERLVANTPFYQALEGLIACAHQQGDRRQAQELQNLQNSIRG